MMQQKRKASEAFQENIEIYSCKCCTFSTYNIDELDKHIAHLHETVEKESVTEKRRTKGNRGSFQKEVKVDGDVYKCTLCTYSTKRRCDMPKHLLTHCSLETSTVYRCSECPYETKRKNDMPKHMLGHCNNVQMFKCPECPYQTKRKNDLPKHLLCHKTADTVPIYRCHYCDYFTKRKGDLPKHIINHEEKQNLKMYHCSVCKYRTKRMNDLHKHMLVHCDRRIAGVFKCLKCEFATDKVHKFSKHVLSSCQNWDNSINMNRMLEDILERADKDGLQVILDDEEEDQCVEVEEGVGGGGGPPPPPSTPNFQGFLQQQHNQDGRKRVTETQGTNGTAAMFNFSLGEFTVGLQRGGNVEVEKEKQYVHLQHNAVHYAENAQYCT